MTLPVLYAVVDADASARAGRTPLDVADAFLRAGVQLLQIRDKQASGGTLLELASAIVGRAAGATIVVNDRADIARLAGAAGVHLGQDDLSVADARTILGPDAIVGLSTHTLDQARRALDTGISYIAVGPVFATRSKNTGYDAVGTTLVTQVAALSEPLGVPVVAIGGITLATAPQVLAAGASSVCVISDLLEPDPGSRARAYLAGLGVGT